MTRDEAIAAICARTPLTDFDVRGVLECAPDELEELVRLYSRDRKVGVDAWRVFVDVLRLSVEVAAFATPLAGAVQAVFGVAQLVK